MNKTIGPVTAGAAAGTTSAAMFATILVWTLAQFNIEMPAEVGVAFGGLIGIIGTLIGGYLVPGKPKGEHEA